MTDEQFDYILRKAQKHNRKAMERHWRAGRETLFGQQRYLQAAFYRQTGLEHLNNNVLPGIWLTKRPEVIVIDD